MDPHTLLMPRGVPLLTEAASAHLGQFEEISGLV